MNSIEHRFKVGDMVQHRFQRGGLHGIDTAKSAAKFFMVLYIHTETCSSGTQVFYRCRSFYPVVAGYGENQQMVDLAFGMGPDATQGLSYFREDELKPVSNEDAMIYGITTTDSNEQF